MDNKRIHIIGGGTVSYIGSHLATCAPAYGSTPRKIEKLCFQFFDDLIDVSLHLTRMANGDNEGQSRGLETNDDIECLIDKLIASDTTKIIFMPVALVDYGLARGSRYGERYSTTKEPELNLNLQALPKLITKIREKRKDIFLVAFKQTCGETEDSQYLLGLDLCKRASANLVLANDDMTKLNMVITPEEARYHVPKGPSNQFDDRSWRFVCGSRLSTRCSGSHRVGYRQRT